ncbi:DUF4878 domain-containing protein [Orbaceae bacterium ESL0721]|nr:DUF4878 domain-containing protein [Orbaceae bacterium ESL0721]
MMKNYIALLALFLGSLLLTGCGNPKPDEVAKDFYLAMVKKDVNKLYNMMYIYDNNQPKKEVVKGKMTTAVNDASDSIASKGGIKQIAVDKVSERDDNAIVVLNVAYNNGSTEKAKIILHKQDNSWKVVLH